MKVHTTYRSIVAMNDTRTLMPLRVDENLEDAQQLVREISEEYGALFGEHSNAYIVAGEHRIVLKNFLVELGIKTVQHGIVSHETHGSLIVQPRAGLVVPHS